jgi:tryptophan synthase alpha chain
MSRINEAFQKANGGLLIGYITAGDPNLEVTSKIAEALIRGGVDILELGLPFSDPIADGPTIQAASLRAINSGITPMKVLEIAKQIRRKNDIPLVIMSYYNPVLQNGLEKFLSKAKVNGVDGFIVPDLPVEEASDYRGAAGKVGLDTIFLASPATSKERLEKIIEASSGFLYLVSRFGVTGAQTSVADSTVQMIKRVKQTTVGRIPLALGFGISKPEHVKTVIAAGAEAAIVGSAFINIIEKNGKNMLSELEASAQELKRATRKQN